MSRFGESELELGPEDDPAERESLIALAERLERERPVCAPGFRGDLRRRLLNEVQARPKAPHRLRALVFAYAGSGLTMLSIAALGVGGVGPLSAG